MVWCAFVGMVECTDVHLYKPILALPPLPKMLALHAGAGSAGGGEIG